MPTVQVIVVVRSRTRVMSLYDQKSVLVDFVQCITTLRSHFRVNYGHGGPVRNRFAEREAKELEELIAQLDRTHFS